MIKISFVIPAYNEEKYVGACIESIVRELDRERLVPGTDAEIIVVNNASTDGTHAVAQSYANVRVIDENRKGVVRARQAGFEASHGDLVAFIDADATLTRGWLGVVLGQFGHSPRLSALGGYYQYVGMSPIMMPLVWLYYGVVYATYLITRALHVGSTLFGGNFVVRRSALEKVGGFNTSIEFYGDDTDAAKSLSKVGIVRFSFRFSVTQSPRRFKGQGLLKTTFLYVINYVWVMVLGRPFTKEYKDVR
jgi:glycosyltransferase involved in cell wall biosynthesis